MEDKKIGIPLEGFGEAVRKAAAEGMVLLKNENQMLPITEKDQVALFGRCQMNYYKSGTGSGGAVNTAYTTNLIDGFRRYKNIVLNEELLKVYEAWIQEHPFDGPVNHGFKRKCLFHWNWQKKPERLPIRLW